MLAARRRHPHYKIAYEYCKQVAGLRFSTGVEGLQWMWRNIPVGRAWGQRKVVYVADADVLSEGKTDVELEAMLLGELL